MQSKELALAAARALDDKKGVDIMVLDVQHLTIIADYFVIASGRSGNQVRALIDEVDDKLSEQGVEPRRREGVNEGRWAVLDYGTVRFEMGYASAIATILFLLMVGTNKLVQKLLRRVGE